LSAPVHAVPAPPAPKHPALNFLLLPALSVENNIQPNLLRNWKKEFLDNAFAVFDDKREDS